MMHNDMTDDELKQLMRAASKIAGLQLSEERINIGLQAFKAQLDAIDAVYSVELALEDEPVTAFRLKPIPE